MGRRRRTPWEENPTIPIVVTLASIAAVVIGVSLVVVAMRDAGDTSAAAASDAATYAAPRLDVDAAYIDQNDDALRVLVRLEGSDPQRLDVMDARLQAGLASQEGRVPPLVADVLRDKDGSVAQDILDPGDLVELAFPLQDAALNGGDSWGLVFSNAAGDGEDFVLKLPNRVPDGIVTLDVRIA